MSEIQLPEAFLKLGEVLEQGQFELLFTEEKLRLVYLMNDAVESFLVFENATDQHSRRGKLGKKIQ